MTRSVLSAAEVRQIVTATHPMPGNVLGCHEDEASGQWHIRVFEPGAAVITLSWHDERASVTMDCLDSEGLFEARLDRPPSGPYRLHVGFRDGHELIRYDAYYFSPEIGELDTYLFAAGNHHHIYRKLGAHRMQRDGVEGTHFAVWAPTARRVSVVGNFNLWDGRRHGMRPVGSSGIWALFVPGVDEGELYKFEIRSHDNRVFLKTDPYAFRMQHRPETASVVCDLDGYDWNDGDWMARRDAGNPLTQPVNIYEVHPGSWRRDSDEFLSWSQLANELIPYVQEMGYTHIELMALAEHPLDRSWGYQVTGYYAANSRHGHPAELMQFVDRCHQAGIGIIMDWVPAHFPRDDFALAQFDGTYLYEHADPRRGEHADWGTKIFNYGRNEVRNFLVSNALFWLEQYHIDGIRVDAVASMLYLDYSREEGNWVPNRFGGRENLEAIDFLRQANRTLFQYYPGIMSIAEESTAFPGVTNPPEHGGLGFNFKWNMGWMNDTLRYMSLDPIHRKHHSSLLTFAMLYAWSENFVLPISHDEVVHGKASLLSKMPGDEWRMRANFRAYIVFMQTHPGKQLLFMGQEFGQWDEWTEARALDWHLLEHEPHQQLQQLCRDMNHLYRETPALYASDTSPDGFRWIECQDAARSVYAYMRVDLTQPEARPVVVVFNFTPVPREGYRIGVPQAGDWRKLLDSDSPRYGGSGYNTHEQFGTEPVPWHGSSHSIVLDLPPLAALILR